MNEAQVLQIAANAMMTGAKIAAPIMLSAMAVGLVISLFQSVTQIQEATLTFVPKVVAVGLVVMLAGHWMLGVFIAYVHSLFASLPQLLAGG
ncbi:MAG TPA: flagellar biosynthesis protein FliQ [Acidimicrobiales bacterium]|nr:flagellar biosynthesis protein FliQ [Acidimicrobiales bacterium]